MKLGGNQGGGGDDDSDMGGASPGGNPDVEPGTCDSWKVSYCNAIKACQSDYAFEVCKETVGYVRCLDDAPVGRCTKEIDASVDEKECDLPDECEPAAIADRREPVAACRKLYQAACEWGFFCGHYLSEEACRLSGDSEVSCSRAIAVLPSNQSCIFAYQTLGCWDARPEACPGLLLD